MNLNTENSFCLYERFLDVELMGGRHAHKGKTRI